MKWNKKWKFYGMKLIKYNEKSRIKDWMMQKFNRPKK